MAVTRTGRVWSARARELRQAPAVGEERILAERNRREQLSPSQRAGRPGRGGARGRSQRAAAESAAAETARDGRPPSIAPPCARSDEAGEERAGGSPR